MLRARVRGEKAVSEGRSNLFSLRAGAWKLWAKKGMGMREGETRGVTPSLAPVFCRAHCFQAPATQARICSGAQNFSELSDAD